MVELAYAKSFQCCLLYGYLVKWPVAEAASLVPRCEDIRRCEGLISFSSNARLQSCRSFSSTVVNSRMNSVF